MPKQQNLPPVAQLEVDKKEITLPDNRVIINASGSYDPMPSGRVVRVEFYSKPEGVIFDQQIINEPVSGKHTSTTYQTGATFPELGDYTIGVNAFDRANIKSTTPAEISVKVNPAKPSNKPVDFGIKVVEGNNAQQITVAQKLGVTMLRTSIEMYQYTGRAKFLDDIFDAGFTGCININWLPAGQPRKFCSGDDLITYEKNLRTFYDFYCPKGGVHKVKYVFCENEPTHDEYFPDLIANYIPVLEIFTRISNEYGVKCGCGGVFIEFINAYLNGGVPDNNKQSQNYKDNMWLIARMKQIPLDYANAHFALKNTFVNSTISSAMKWLSTTLVRPVGTNEFHVAGATPAQLKQALQEFVDGGCEFIQVWGGGAGTPADALNIGIDLTELGRTLRDFIKDYNAGVI